MIEGAHQLAALPAPRALLEAAKAAPSRVRFIDRERSYMLGDLVTRVAARVEYLRDRRIGRGDHVALFAENSVDWVTSALAIQACGAAFVGVHAGSSSALADFIVRHSQAKLLLASSSELARAGLETTGCDIVDIVTATAALTASSYDSVARPLDRACIIYTSGTTGNPKGAMLSHANLAANGADWMTCCAPLLGTDPIREVLWLPFTHIFGWGDAVIGTIAGIRSRLAAPSEVAATLADHRPHLLMTVPALLERLARDASDADALRARLGGEIRLCLAGGAALSPVVKRRYRDAGICVLEGYGLTETSPTLTLQRPDDPEIDGVGHPYPSVEVKLADDGEVLARGPSVFAGYYRDPNATREVIDGDGWFHTGDLGAWLPGGQLKIVDRKKELLVLSNGKKVAPQPIEARAAEDPWIERVVLFGTGRPAVAGLVVPNFDNIERELGRKVDRARTTADTDVMTGLKSRIDALNARLSTFERIRAFAIAPRTLTAADGHLTPSLKVKRRAVWADFSQLIEPLWERTTQS
ncbi:MAG: long-chain fatty acid--CoA ligase [Kofleriaceae bacterium]